MKRAALWLVALPLMLAGTEVAHALAYRIVYPVAAVRWQVLAETGHGYLGLAPIAFGVGGAVVLAGVVSTAVDTVRRRELRPLPAWAFGLLPILGFTVQELVERLLTANALPWWMFEQPTFRVGLALQLPFALLAYVAARFLLRVGRAIGRIVGGNDARPLAFPAERLLRTIDDVVRPRSFAGGWSVRGPPLPSA